MSSVSPTQPRPLEYDTRPIVGIFTCERRDGELTLTSLRDRYLLGRGAATVIGGITLIVATAVAHLRGAAWIDLGTHLAIGLVGLGLVLIVRGGHKLLVGLRPAVLHVDARRLTLTRRAVFEVERGEWQREWVVDVRAKRLRFRDVQARPWVVVAVLTTGLEVELLRGTRAEVEFAAGELRRVLGLPPERWIEEGYPPPLAWAPVSRTVTADGVALAFRPPLVPWLSLALASPLFVMGWVYLLNDLAPEYQIRWTRGPWQSVLSFVAPTVIIVICVIMPLCSLVRLLRRSTLLTVDAGRLLWSETGLRPGHAEWPLDDVWGFDSAPARFRRMDLRVVFRDGGTATLLRRRTAREVRWAAENLQRAAAAYVARVTAAASGAAAETSEAAVEPAKD